MVRWNAGPSKPSGRAIWQLAGDPYHTEFVLWHVYDFNSFPLRGVGGWGLDLENSIFSEGNLALGIGLCVS